MSAKYGDRGMTGSVPNVKRAAQVKDAKQAQLTADVSRRRKGSQGTQLAALVKKSIR